MLAECTAMLALLQRQQEKHAFASAVGSSLLERTQRQEEHQQAVALRWQWNKIQGQLRNRETALFYELKQLLASQHLVALGSANFMLDAEVQETLLANPSPLRISSRADALAEGTIQPTIELQACRVSQTRSVAAIAANTQCKRNTDLSSPVDVEPQRHMSEDHTNSLVFPSDVQHSPFANLTCGLSSIAPLLKQWNRAVKEASSNPTHTGHYSPSGHPAIPRVQQESTRPKSTPDESWRNHPCQVAACIFQLFASVLREHGAALEQRYRAARVEASAALAALREEGVLPQQLLPPLQQQAHRQLNPQGDEQSLTDREDTILRGEAPQVQAAAEAAAEVASVLSRKAAKVAEGQQHSNRQRPADRHLVSTDCGAPAVPCRAQESLERCSTTQMSPGGNSSLQHSSWEDVLIEYSKKLLDLEEKHTKELQHYRREIWVHKDTLRQAVARLLSVSSSMQYIPEVVSVEAHPEHRAQQDALSNGCHPASNTFPALQREDVTEATEEVGNESGLHFDLLSCKSLPDVADQHFSCKHAAAASKPVICASHQSGENGGRTEEALEAALATVRWFAMTSRAEGSGGEHQPGSLLQRLQIAFPLASLGAIRTIAEAQQQVSLLQQRLHTCIRMWKQLRLRSLADVLNELKNITCEHRQLAENHKASMVLKARRKRLSEKLQLQKKQREEHERRIAATAREELKAQRARELEQANQEKLRREKEKILLARFHQKKLLDEQQQQAQAAQEQLAAKEPPHVKLVRAARVARRQEQHSLRLLEQQLERKEAQLQEELLRHRMLLAADKLKPLAERDPSRLHRQTASSHAYAEARVQQHQQKQEQLQNRLASFDVENSYSCVALMRDIRFRLSAALAESQLTSSKAAQELLLSMSRGTETREGVF